MAHEISVTKDGLAEAMYAGKPAWHGLGQVLENAPTSKDAMEAAHLNWNVKKVPCFASIPVEGGLPLNKLIEGCFATVREDTNDTLGIVRDRYQILQNVEAFGFMDTVLNEADVRYEACGALRGGQMVWLLAKLPNVGHVTEGDQQNLYALLFNSHDGSRAVTIIPTAVRVVCMNTLQLAERQAGAKKLRIIHSGSISEKMEEARAVLGLCGDRFAEYLKEGQQLVRRAASKDEADEYFKILLPKESTRTGNVRSAMLNTFVREDDKLPTVYGTAWAAFNAVTDHVDHAFKSKGHDAVSRMDNRFINIVMTQGAELKRSAIDLALKHFTRVA
jgi:phage/plasmid-like protein (TIGR03299 family)